MVTLVNIMVMNGRLTSFSFHVNGPWNIQGQSHEWGQRSRSHIIPSIQPMHSLFISHQSVQSFLRYGQNSLTFKKHIQNFLRKSAKIIVSNKTSPKSNQVMTMMRAIKLPRSVVIVWVVLTLLCRQQIFANRCNSRDLGPRSRKVIYRSVWVTCELQIIWLTMNTNDWFSVELSYGLACLVQSGNHIIWQLWVFIPYPMNSISSEEGMLPRWLTFKQSVVRQLSF